MVSPILSRKDSRTIGRSLDETREYHERYLMAVNSPVRRTILRALEDGSKTIEALQTATGLQPQAFEWHLSVLEHGFCVKKEIRGSQLFYELTQEGKVVDFMDK